MAASIAELQTEVAVLKQQLEGAAAEKALLNSLLISKDSLLASNDSLLAANDRELQSLRAGISADGSTVKRARLTAEDGSISILDKDEILDEVFSFVGLGEYYYAAGVSTRWRGRYIKLCYTEAAANNDKKLWTSNQSSIVTAARLQVALDASLSMASLQEDMMRLGTDVAAYSLEAMEVLKLAKIYDLPWSCALASKAAYHNRLQLLKWLRSVQCPWDEAAVVQNAAYRGGTELLDWVQSQVDTTVWENNLRFMLDIAADYDNLEAVQWLRQHAAAEWPDSFCDSVYDLDNDDELVNTCWSQRAVQWALANGCTWGGWHCSLYSAERYTGRYERQAAEVFEWAHKNGCPCTCEQEAADAA
jgi:hypothetical protein